MKLGTLLIRDGIINLDQLESALRTQVLFGGRLGTNLVELGHLSLDLLGEYLGKIHGLPVATTEIFNNVSPATCTRLSAAQAQTLRSIPLFARGTGENAALAVAVADPRDPAVLASLSAEMGADIVVHAAAELRIFFYLEKYYGIERNPRFVRPDAPSAGHPVAVSERRRVIEPTRLTTASEVRIDPKQSGARAVGRVAPAKPAVISLGAARARLDQAEDRVDGAAAFWAVAQARAGACILFLVKGRMALGWKGFAPGVSPAATEELAVPLTGGSVLGDAEATRKTQRVAPSARLDKALFDALRIASPPREALVIPVTIGSRVVNLIYAHAHDRSSLDDELVEGFGALGVAATKAFMRLITVARKKS